jgi:NlpC/P60 family
VIRKIACAVPVCLLLFVCNALAEDVVDLAAKLIGRPYVWGAEGPHSFDCSGLTQFVYQKVGIELPRRAISQSKVGDRAGSRFQRGDLLFFSNDSKQSLVTHVGLYEGNGVMIDASKRHGRVRRDSLDDPFWVERFMFARRVSSSMDADEVPDRRTDRTDPPSRSSDRRRVAVRIVERIAGELFKLPRR